ncbi:hypothetical protein DPMN_165714 [Dreissena polymorpha]|uniref:Uncharacterized protein n=1 Tax=Dreissena polymorpha TaxID=45954 RepID=A0A9D4EY46_DREPO|nr:hypothetical protein DPMN_165714 [Dreissena polymorpha]
MPFGPGAEPVLAFFTTCCTSDNDGSFVSKGVSGGSSGSSLEQSPNGTSCEVSLWTLRKCCSMSAILLSTFPDRSLSRMSLVNWYGFWMNLALCLSLFLFLCLVCSALLRVLSFSRKVLRNCWSPTFPSSLAFLYCLFTLVSSFLVCLISLCLLLMIGAGFSGFFSAKPNLSLLTV